MTYYALIHEAAQNRLEHADGADEADESARLVVDTLLRGIGRQGDSALGR
ncbi:hypothetical protein GCM10010430_38400 [Kitasatospora cystarginea]|uniref:Uncharacterized protein n=1 Tax=Kitasatospora cystarginea TaxID=58350 RepID=A0ABN3E8Y5_9ACTN